MADRVQRSDGESRSNSVVDALSHSNLHTHLRGEILLFLLLSIADVLLTFKLLYHGGHFESNPIARYFIDGWGPKGMVYFKFAMVAFVCVIVQIIAHKRVETARWVLIFAIVVLGFVVFHSAKMYIMATA